MHICIIHDKCMEAVDVLNLVYVQMHCMRPVPTVLQTEHPATADEHSEATSKCTFPERANCGIKK